MVSKQKERVEKEAELQKTEEDFEVVEFDISVC